MRLVAEGFDVSWRAWDDLGVDWGAFDAVVVRSTWDFQERRDEFLGWCSRCSGPASGRPCTHGSTWPPANGAPVVLEVELTEPSLFFRHADGAAGRFVAALSRRISRSPV